MGSIDRKPLSDIISSFADHQRIDYFIETGTFIGESAKWASENFQHVVTFEIDKHIFDKGNELLESCTNVERYHCDSISGLKEVLPRISNCRSLFWLDAHFSGGITGGVDSECPILEEIDLIIRTMEVPPIILIDDAHMHLLPPPIPFKEEHWPTFDEILDSLKKDSINRFHYLLMNTIISIPEHLHSDMRNDLVNLMTDRFNNASELGKHWVPFM